MMSSPTIPAQTVLFTPDLEPITILELPPAVRTFLERRGRVKLAVKEMPLTRHLEASPDAPFPAFRTVEIWIELFFYRNARTFMLFTHDDENALLLKAAFLPGQHRQIKEERAGAFAKGFMRALYEIRGCA